MKPEGTAFTSARHLSLSRARTIQSTPPHPTFLKIHLNIILSSSPGSTKLSHSQQTTTAITNQLCH